MAYVDLVIEDIALREKVPRKKSLSETNIKLNDMFSLRR